MRLRTLSRFLLLGLSAGVAWGQFTLTTNPNPSTVGQTITMTATANPNPGTVAVTFRDQTTNQVLGGTTMTGSGIGTATIFVSTLSAGQHNIIASYPSTVTQFTNTVIQTVNRLPTSTAINTSNSQTTYCNPVTFTVVVSPPPPGGSSTAVPVTPTGTVQFSDGSNSLGTTSLTNGATSLTVSTLSGGVHTIAATYNGDQLYATSTNSLTQTVNRAVPGMSLTSAPNPSNIGQTVTITTTVAACPVGATPSGNVAVFDGQTQIGQGPLNKGVAVLQTAALSAGTHPLDSLYSGDSNYLPNSSNNVNQVVGPGSSTSTTTLTGTPNPSAVGQTVTLTASVIPATATGNVLFQEGSTTLGQAPLVNGVATFQISTLALGSHLLVATYNGDQLVSKSTSPVFTQVVGGKTNTTTSLTPSANPVAFGQPLTLTAAVAPSGATGQVQFRDSGVLLGNGNLANGIATFTTSSLASGVHSLSATYVGDNNFNPSTSSVLTLTVGGGTTSVSLQVSPNPATVGQTVSMSALVQPSGATGTVSFRDGGVLLQTVNLNNGVAVFSTSSFTAGSHTITAQYSGDSTFASATSNAIVLVVNPGSTNTTTILSANPANTTFGQVVNLTATVNPGNVTGSVTFNDGANSLGTTSLQGNTAVFSTSTLTVGTHTLTATYNGDSTFLTSTSNPITVIVAQATTTTTLTVTPTSITPGQGVLMTARVAPAAATGIVTFRDGTAIIGTGTLAAGVAGITTSNLTAGTHTITAVYGGDTNFSGSTSAPVTVSVGLTATTTTLAAAPTAPGFGGAVTFTATVAPNAATGSVSFQEGSTVLGSGTLNNGVATFTTSALTGGAHSITAVYAGDTKFATSTSAPVTVTVGKVATTTTLSVSPNPAIPGQSVTFTGTVTPSTATGTVTFLDGSNSIGSGTLSNGVATFSTSSLAVGAHSVTASYAGDNNSLPSTSAAVSLPVATVTPLGAISPTSLPTGIVNVVYSQTFTVAGGTAPFNWTLAAGSVPGLTLSQGGQLSGTPTTAGTTSLTIRVVDARQQATATVISLTVLPQPAVSISVTQPNALTDQPIPQVSVPSFPAPLVATFSLTFTPDGAVKGVPSPFANADVLFPNGTTTSAPVNIPANSTIAFPVQPVQLGSVGGVITVRLASLTSNGQPLPLPATVPSTTITVRTGVPVINSVKITGVTSTGFQVIVVGSSTTRDLTSANLTFSAASGTQLNGGQQTVSLTSASNAWFVATAGNPSLLPGRGGNFAVTMSFAYSGDTTAIGSVSVILANSVGNSTAVSGGK